MEKLPHKTEKRAESSSLLLQRFIAKKQEFLSLKHDLKKAKEAKKDTEYKNMMYNDVMNRNFEPEVEAFKRKLSKDLENINELIEKIENRVSYLNKNIKACENTINSHQNEVRKARKNN